jgi:hypothetical protein
MHHHAIESELRYLENVLPHAGNGPFPVSYWQGRLASLPASGTVPAYHRRIERLKILLRDMEKAAFASESLTMAA